MAGLVFACIAPHGGEVIAELAGDNPSRMATTRAAMEKLGRRMARTRPQTVVVITPHGLRVNGAVCVMATQKAYGVLGDGVADARVEVDMDVDTALALAIAGRAAGTYGVPTAAAIYGASSGEGCVTPLDWGAVVPLWFLGARWETKPSLVVMTPSRELELEQLHDFGRAIAEAAEQSGRRVALVASADWGHAHDPKGPYGFDPAAAEFDAMAQRTISEGDLDAFLSTDLDFADRAKVDGLWQAVMLAGALRHTPMRGELLSYEVPTYFGMLVASYERAPAPRG